jgi:SAM-dependent methyltransferase
MKTTILALAIAAAVTGVAGEETKHSGHDATVHHEFKNAEKWAETFESPERFEWQKPGIVIRVLGLEEGYNVADLGAGTGYFTQILSREVGSGGIVYAVDIEPDMIAFVDQRTDLGPATVRTVLARPDDPGLPPRELDVVLAVNTWHHIDDRLNYLERLRQTLRPGGRLAIVDWHEGELPMGPPAGHKLSRDDVVAEFAEANWHLGTESVALPYQYFLVFYPPE